MADESIPEYLLHVWIRQISPMIGQRFLVCSGGALASLHDAIQIAFGWTDSHLHIPEASIRLSNSAASSFR